MCEEPNDAAHLRRDSPIPAGTVITVSLKPVTEGLWPRTGEHRPLQRSLSNTINP